MEHMNNDLLKEAAELRKEGHTWKKVRELLLDTSPIENGTIPALPVLNTLVLKHYPRLRVRPGYKKNSIEKFLVSENRQIEDLKNIIESNLKDKIRLCKAILKDDR